MLLIVGYIITLAASVGTFCVEGNIASLFVPMEYLAIIGLGLGCFLGSNVPAKMKATISATLGLLKPTPYNKAFYVEVLAMLFEILAKVRKEGLMSIENDVENPEGSPIFTKYPGFQHDHHALEFLTDYLRMMVGGNLNAFELESLMDAEIETHHAEAHEPAHIMSKLGDAMPAFGIVVAVMGVVNVMGSVGEPPAVLGHMIGGALVGTFLGILVAYGFVGPIASQLEQKGDASGKIFLCMKSVLLASMSGYAPQVAVEFGRKVLFSADRPGFAELEAEIKSRKK
jgi:chemotaxis protein MotA